MQGLKKLNSWSWTKFGNWVVAISLLLEAVQLGLFSMNTLETREKIGQEQSDNVKQAAKGKFLKHVNTAVFVDMKEWLPTFSGEQVLEVTTAVALATVILLVMCVQLQLVKEVRKFGYLRNRSQKIAKKGRDEETRFLAFQARRRANDVFFFSFIGAIV